MIRVKPEVTSLIVNGHNYYLFFYKKKVWLIRALKKNIIDQMNEPVLQAHLLPVKS